MKNLHLFAITIICTFFCVNALVETVKDFVDRNESMNADEIEQHAKNMKDSIFPGSNSKNEESIPKKEESIPKNEESSPKKEESSPKNEESSPKNEESIPKKEHSSPKNEESIPKKEHSSPKKRSKSNDKLSRKIKGKKSENLREESRDRENKSSKGRNFISFNEKNKFPKLLNNLMGTLYNTLKDYSTKKYKQLNKTFGWSKEKKPFPNKLLQAIQFLLYRILDFIREGFKKFKESTFPAILDIIFGYNNY